jgi:hypothetical protein
MRHLQVHLHTSSLAVATDCTAACTIPQQLGAGVELYIHARWLPDHFCEGRRPSETVALGQSRHL